MKIRFSSDKERNPTQEDGLKVLYAPGKRMAFRLRWYLILFLVGSPLLWFFGRLGLGYLRVEAPAQLEMPVIELRALDAGQVTALPVKAGERVSPGQLLLQLDNPAWRERISQLQGSQPLPLPALPEQSLRLQRESVELARQRVSQLQALLARGAATRGELLQAEAQLNSQQQALLDLQWRIDQQGSALRGEQQQASREGSERKWLEQRLAALAFVAPMAARVSEVLVGLGENVGPGTLLMRLDRLAEPLLLIYLEPRDAAYAAPGRLLEVRMPDGSWLPARVLQAADSARRLPAGMQKPFTVSQMGLLVAAEFEQPLPALWRVDQLPLRVRFPHDWGLFFGLDE